MVGDVYHCSGGRTLRVTRQARSSNGRPVLTFVYNDISYTMPDTTPYGGHFAVYGDTSSPKGTGFSFSGSGIGVVVNGNIDLTCK